MRIPLGKSGAFLDLGSHYTRYWMHESDNIIAHGTLYAKDSYPDHVTNKSVDAVDDDNSFDCYSLRQKDLNPIQHPDPDWIQGGSYPSYDAYHVSGISCTLRYVVVKI